MIPRLASARCVILALSSALLLVLSFPGFNQPWCAWGALVPWLVLLRRVGARGAFWWSYVVGLLFFLGSLWWLLYLIVFGAAAALGYIALCAYLALFFAVFGWFTYRLFSSHLSPLISHLAVASVWVAVEYARSHLLTGFGWNLLAYSQTSWLPVIQIADVTGVWGVSCLMVLMNILIADCVERGFRRIPNPEPRTPNRAQPALWRTAIAGGAVFLTVLGYGTWRLTHRPVGAAVRVAVVQGNIPQTEKWDEAYQAKNQQRYAELTAEAAKTAPDLIVWPETSVPGFFGVDEALMRWVGGVATSVQPPLLVGAPIPTLRNGRVRLTNSAVLLDRQRLARQRYDKLHLVPFGEFIPFEQQAPWLRNMLPPIGDFVPGKDYTVFHLGSGLRVEGSGQPSPQPIAPSHSSSEPTALNPELRFSVLICFEDVFPELARRFVQAGARLLLVITNDAWFGPTAAAYQHAQASTFRAVELRVPVIRAANTGWSGCIDATGAWTGSVHDAAGRELFVDGIHACEPAVGTESTLYARFGDWFAWLCLIMTLGIIICLRRRGFHG